MTQQEILQELRRHGGSLAVAAANEIDKSFYLAAKEKMLAGVREAQKTAKDAGSQITIGEIAEAVQQGGRPV